MPEVFAPITIRYSGQDADRNEIELGALGESLQGAARMIALSSNFVLTRQLAVRAPAFSVRVLAGTSRSGSWEIPALIAPIVPVLPDILQAVSSSVVESLVNWALAKFGGRSAEADRMRDVCMRALEEQGLSMRAAMEELAITSRTAIEEQGETSRAAVDAQQETSRVAIESLRAIAEKVIDAQRAPARRLVRPIGESCETLSIGSPDTAIPVTRAMKDAILQNDDLETLDEQNYSVLFTELDTRNKTGKLSIRGDSEEGRRYNAVINDPAIRETGNPYGRSLTERLWITVRAQMQLKDGEPHRIYVSRGSVDDIAA